MRLRFSNSGGAVVLDGRPNGVGSLGGGSITSRTRVPSMGAAAASRGALDDVNMFSRDDDENFSGYICPRVTKKPPRSVPRVGDRRIRKILASRHWKGGSRHSGSNPHCLKGSCLGFKSLITCILVGLAEAKSWRSYYLHHQRSYPIKKRKYFEHISDSVSDDYRLRSKMQRGKSDTFSFVLIPLSISFLFNICSKILEFMFCRQQNRYYYERSRCILCLKRLSW